MFLIYNREYQLVGEVSDLQLLKDQIGEDYDESKLDTLEFTRGKTVITGDNLKRIVNTIVTTEKDLFVGYMTAEIEHQEDESVELKTSNRHLQNKLYETRDYLSEVSSKLGKALEDTEDTSLEESELEDVNVEEDNLEESESVFDTPKEDTYESTTDLGTETESIFNHIEKPKKEPVVTRGTKKKRSASVVIPNRKRRVNADINFISIIEGGKVAQIKELAGKSMVKTAKLADDVGLDREHIEYLIEVTLKDCGGSPRYQNKSIVSQAEAVWVIVSALTKREGYGNTQRFQKTKENAEDFYQAWDSQKGKIETMLG